MDRKDWRVMQFLAPKFKASYNKEKDEFNIMGEAIHATTTRNGTIFTVEELQNKAHSLQGKPLLKDHVNSVDHIMGRVTAAKWDAARNAVVFKAKVTDKAMREKINSGDVMNVSVGAMVDDVEEIESDGKYTYLLKNIEFLELSLVAIPADPAAGFGIAQAVQAAFQAKKSVVAAQLPAVAASHGTTAYIGPAYATSGKGTYTHTSTSFTNTQPAKPAVEEKKVDEKHTEEPAMENSNPTEKALADELSKISETLATVSERLDKLEKAPVQEAAPVAETKPESKGKVNAAAQEPEARVSGEYIIERHGNRANVQFASYDKARFPNLAGKTPMRAD